MILLALDKESEIYDSDKDSSGNYSVNLCSDIRGWKFTLKIIKFLLFSVEINRPCVTFLFVDEEEPQIREVVEEEVLEEDPIDDDEEEAVVQAAPAQPEVGFFLL